MNWGKSELVKNLYLGKLPEVKTDNTVTVDEGSLRKVGLLVLATIVVVVLGIIIVKSVPKAT